MQYIVSAQNLELVSRVFSPMRNVQIGFYKAPTGISLRIGGHSCNRSRFAAVYLLTKFPFVFLRGGKVTEMSELPF